MYQFGAKTMILRFDRNDKITILKEMDPIYLEETQDTAKVILNKNDGVFELSGRSLPEDSVKFFSPIIKWIKEYGKAPNPTTIFKFKLDYFNTASSKLILDLLNTLKEINGIKIEWHYRDDDEDILEAGKEFTEQVNIPFEFRSVD
jgi:hypothetical protein